MWQRPPAALGHEPDLPSLHNLVQSHSSYLFFFSFSPKHWVNQMETLWKFHAIAEREERDEAFAQVFACSVTRSLHRSCPGWREPSGRSSVVQLSLLLLCKMLMAMIPGSSPSVTFPLPALPRSSKTTPALPLTWGVAWTRAPKDRRSGNNVPLCPGLFLAGVGVSPEIP